jgi:hypothetical protein
MGLLTERMEELALTVTTPDEIATGRLRGRSDVTMSLAPGYFPTSTPERLADKVARVGELLWSERQRAYWRAVSEATGDDQSGEEPPTSPRDAAYRAARDAITCEGQSPDGVVGIRTAGMSAWSATVDATATGALDELAFTQAAGAAISATLADYFARVREIGAMARAGLL